MGDTIATTRAEGSEKEPEKPKDPEVERLEKQTARVAARQKLIEAQLGAVSALATGVTDGPKNTVMFGETAGSLAPWLAQSVLADVATAIAADVLKVFGTGDSGAGTDDESGATAGTVDQSGATAATVDQSETRQKPGPSASSEYVIFVTDDRELLASDVVSRQIQVALRGRTQDARAVIGNLKSAMAELEKAVARYNKIESARDRDRNRSLSGGTRQLLQSVVTQATEAAAAAAESADVPQAAAAGVAATPTGEAEESTPSAAGGSGPLAAAVDLVRLLAVDYTVAAAEVTVDSSLLARITSGALASTSGQPPIVVLVDGFALADNSTTLKAYDALTEVMTTLSDAIQDLDRDVAPVVAEAEEYALAVSELQSAWTETAADKDAAPGAADELQEAFEELTKRLTAREAAAAPATALVASSKELIATVRNEAVALATPDPAGISPLQRACSRDRLHDRTNDATKPVTHILAVEVTHAGADIVTRRSILGASGRVGYLGGANGAWVMIDVHGQVLGGGGVGRASNMSHDIASGESRMNGINPGSGALSGTDPLEQNEKWIRGGVLALALALALIGVAAMLSVFL